MLFQHETFLIGADRCPDDFLWQFEKGRIEFAGQHDRPFDEPRDLIEECFILDEFEPLRQGEIMCVVKNDVAPPRGVEHDFGFFQRRRVIVEAAHFDFAGRHESVAECEIVRTHAIDSESDNLRVFRLRAECGEDRVKRTHPAQGVGPYRRGAPAHGFWPRKAFDHGGQDLGQDILRVPALLLDDRDIEFALFGIPLDFGLRERCEARAFQKTLHGGIGCANARPALLLARIRLAGWQTRYVQGEPPGRGEARGAFMGKPARGQGFGDEPAEIFGRLRLHAGGNFLGKKFKKKIWHCVVSARG